MPGEEGSVIPISQVRKLRQISPVLPLPLTPKRSELQLPGVLDASKVVPGTAPTLLPGGPRSKVSPPGCWRNISPECPFTQSVRLSGSLTAPLAPTGSEHEGSQPPCLSAGTQVTSQRSCSSVGSKWREEPPFPPSLSLGQKASLYHLK